VAAEAAVEAEVLPAVVAPTPVPATPPAASSSPPSSDDVEELFRAKAFALLSEPQVLDAIRRDLTGKSAVARQKVLLGLVQALKREGKGGGSPTLNVVIAGVPRPSHG